MIEYFQINQRFDLLEILRDEATKKTNPVSMDRVNQILTDSGMKPIKNPHALGLCPRVELLLLAEAEKSDLGTPEERWTLRFKNFCGMWVNHKPVQKESYPALINFFEEWVNEHEKELEWETGDIREERYPSDPWRT